MKHIRRASMLLALLFLAACGTIQVEFIPAPTFTPFIGPTPTAMTFAIPPEQCSQFKNDAALPANPDEPGSYIGKHYDAQHLPAGLVFQRGDTLSDNGEYTWEWVSGPDLELEFIVQTNCRKTDGSPYTTIVDAIQLPRESPGYGRAGYCLPDPSPGPFIVFGRYDQNQPQVTLGSAQGWAMFNLDYGQHIDLQTMRFAPYPVDGLECLRLSRPGG
jgi:hypothetical protein